MTPISPPPSVVPLYEARRTSGTSLIAGLLTLATAIYVYNINTAAADHAELTIANEENMERQNELSVQTKLIREMQQDLQERTERTAQAEDRVRRDQEALQRERLELDRQEFTLQRRWAQIEQRVRQELTEENRIARDDELLRLRARNTELEAQVAILTAPSRQTPPSGVGIPVGTSLPDPGRAAQPWISLT